MTVVQVLPWVLSVGTLIIHWLAGNKWKYTYLLGLGNQAIWFLWVFMSENYGFLPLNIFLSLIYIRNHIRWTHDAKRRARALEVS